MRKQLLALTFVVAIAAVIQFGCGGTATTRNTTSVGSAPGSVLVYAGDDPLCGILSLNVTVTALSLTPQGTNIVGGSTPVSVLPGGQPFTLDFASLMDFVAPLNLASVAAGTYDQLNVTLSNPQLTFWDTSKTTPGPTTITPTFSSLTIHLTLDPPLVVASNGTVAVQLNFNLLKSVTVSNGQISGTITPVFTGMPFATPTNNQFAEFDALRGIVQSVQAASGSFTIQPASGPALTVYTSDTTTLDGISSLSELTAGMFVEVHAIADSTGKIVAQELVAELSEDAASGKVAFLGEVTSVTRSAGSATQFNLYIREEYPDVRSSVPLHSVVTFNVVPSTTTFFLTAQGADFAGLGFDATSLAVGQRVVVHGQLPGTIVSGSPIVADARTVYLGLQSILGTVVTTSPIVRSTNDPKLGGFTMLPCSPILQGQPSITVLTADQTAFAGLSDLNGLTTVPPLPTLIVKGLLFYEQSSGSQNSVTWTPPANVDVAAQVHQVQ